MLLIASKPHLPKKNLSIFGQRGSIEEGSFKFEMLIKHNSIFIMDTSGFFFKKKENFLVLESKNFTNFLLFF